MNKKKTGDLTIAESRYQELAEHATDGIFIFQDGTFKLKNERFGELLGFTDARPFFNDPNGVLFLERLKEYQRKAGKEPKTDKDVTSFRFAVSSKDTTRRGLEVVMMRIEYQGRPAVHGMVRDDNQRDGEKIAPDPITIAAHEIRTAITVIQGSNRILLRKQLGPLTRAQEEMLKNCLRGCDRLKSIVQQIFDHAQTEGNEIKRQFRKGNIGDCLIKVHEECRSLAQHKNIALRRRISKQAVLTIPLDHYKIEQVLINLINNAIENTPEGGQVEIQVKPYTENFTKVCVLDTGRGVPAEERECIFKAFEKGKNSQSGRGLGLGLAICRKIIELHEGKIWVEPRKGGGSKFIFTLPVRRS